MDRDRFRHLARPEDLLSRGSIHSGLKMPSFFGYMGYSLAVLGPIFVVVTAVFVL